MTREHVCECRDPRRSGRRYLHREACRLCGGLIYDAQTRKALRAEAERMAVGRTEPNWRKSYLKRMEDGR